MLVVVRGDHRVNEIKLANALGAPLPARPRPRSSRSAIGAGRLHRAGRRRRADPARRGARGRRGLRRRRQQPDAHLRGVEPGRDFAFERGRRAHASRRATRARRQPDPDRARDRGRQHLQARHALLRAARRDATSTRRARSSRSGWAPTGSARRASWPPRSSSSPTSTASRGRASIAPVRRRARRRSARRASEARARRRAALRRAARRRPRRALRRPRRAARARSSPTPSCSAARCG